MKVIVRYSTEFGSDTTIINVKEIPTFTKSFTILNVKQYKKEKHIDGNETPLKEWQLLKYRMDEEGFAYCFDGYSNWEEIKNQQFHTLRKKFIKSMKKLKNYINNKTNQK